MHRKVIVWTSSLLGTLWLNSCGFTAEEHHHEYRHQPSKPPEYKPTDFKLPPYWDTRVKKCTSSMGSGLSCVEDDNTVWHTNCSGNSCREIKLSVHYMLNQDLGSAQSVHVEAFNNPQFAGKPVGATRISHFSATGPGENRKSVMFLNDGVYFFRAYVANKDDTIVPYEYEGMAVVAERPMGVFGAMSGVTEFVVGPKDVFDNTVDIYIDKLFKKEQSAEPTKAFLRVLLSAPADYEVPAHRQVIIELFDKDDFAYAPVRRFEVASENLKVAGREGKTEFLSPELPEGSYYVRAYLDLSDNQFWDEDEPFIVFAKDGQKAKAQIVKDRTETMSLPMTTAQGSSDRS